MCQKQQAAQKTSSYATKSERWPKDFKCSLPSVEGEHTRSTDLLSLEGQSSVRCMNASF